MSEGGSWCPPMPLRMKVHRQGRETLLAAADAAVVGRHLKEGKLALLVSEAFYGTDDADEATLVAQLRACTIANLVGDRVVAIAVKHGFVDPELVLVIEGVPHAQLASL